MVVLPEARHRRVDSNDAERALILEQLHAARAGVLDGGSMTAEEYDTDLEALKRQAGFEEFRTNARIIVLGQRSLPPPQ